MKTKELKIIIPKNHEIDWQESAKQKKIVFKKKDTKPRSWKEYCEQYNTTVTNRYFIDSYAELRVAGWYPDIPSDKKTEAFRLFFPRFLAGLVLQDLAQLFHKGIDIFKFPVNRSEPDISHLIQIL